MLFAQYMQRGSFMSGFWRQFVCISRQRQTHCAIRYVCFFFKKKSFLKKYFFQPAFHHIDFARDFKRFFESELVDLVSKQRLNMQIIQKNKHLFLKKNSPIEQ